MNDPTGIEHLVERIPVLACPQCGGKIATGDAAIFDTAACPACGARLRVPARFGQFLLMQPTRREESVATFAARDRALKRDVILKVLVGDAARDPQLVRQFELEARKLAPLNHPHVGKVYSVGEHAGAPYIVMERVPGHSLAALIEQRGRLDEQTVARAGADAISGLIAARQAGLVHCEVRPDNIVIDPEGAARVTQFGVWAADDRRRQAARVLEQPHYVAPEIVRGAAHDWRSDLFSLGATLFHAAVGVRPFAGETARQVLEARLAGPMPDVRDVDAMIHSPLADVIAHMMEPSPEQRYENYEAARDGLRAVAGGTHGGEPPAPEPAARPHFARPAPRRASKRAMVVAVSTLLLFVVLVVGALVAALTMMNGGGLSGPSGFSDSFDQPALDPAWRAVGTGGALTGNGRYLITHAGYGPAVGLRRRVDDGAFDGTLVVSQITWNRVWEQRLTWEFSDADSDLRVEVYKPSRGTARVRAAVVRQGSVVAEQTASLGGEPAAVTLTVAWRPDAGRWEVSFAQGGQAPTALPAIELGEAAGGGSAERTMRIVLWGEGGQGVFVAEIDAVRVER